MFQERIPTEPQPKIFVAKTRTYLGFFVYYHLVLTDECNLRCSYCRGRIMGDAGTCDPTGHPEDFTLDTGALCSFLQEDADASVIFYGGEPLLRSDLVEELVKSLPTKSFFLHTNGTLLERLGSDTVSALERIQVSIDGRKDVTDAKRGAGTYEKIARNLKKLRDDGYKGELVARMTVEKGDSISESVLHLDNLPFFSSVHWQLDAMFSDNYDPSFARWAENEYNPAIGSLVREWIRIMEREGRVPRWYPFLAPVSGMLAGECDNRLRCGCGFENYTVMANGGIAPCPCMYGFEGYTLGHIDDMRPSWLPVIMIDDPCTGCDIRNFCGGRCLYAHAASLWPDEGRAAVCGTVRALKNALEASLPRIRELIADGKIKEEDFSFERYWGCEVIP